MKKRMMLLLLFLLYIMVPLVVNAGGEEDDNAVSNDELVRTSCTYHDSKTVEDRRGPRIQHTWFTFDFTGIGGANSTTIANVKIQRSMDDGDLSLLSWKYDQFMVPQDLVPTWVIGDLSQTRWEINAFWNNVLNDNKKSKEQLEKAKDSGAFCPSTVYAVHDYNENTFKFIFCNGINSETGDSTCVLAQKYIHNHEELYATEKDGKYNYVTYSADYYDNVTISGSTIDNQESVKEDIGKEIYETEKEIEDICNPDSKNYDEQKCNVKTEVSKDILEEYASDVGGYTEYNPELPQIETGRVTCASIFKNGDDYNNTWKLLNSTLKFMQYLAITLALVLSIIDFIKVVPTNDKAALKKSATKAAMRVGIAIVVFFIPIILNLILGLVGFTDATCGLL